MVNGVQVLLRMKPQFQFILNLMLIAIFVSYTFEFSLIASWYFYFNVMNKFFKDKYSPFDVSWNEWKKKKL